MRPRILGLALALGGCASDGDGDAAETTGTSAPTSAPTSADDGLDDDGSGPGTTLGSSGSADDADTTDASTGSADDSTTGSAGGCGRGGGDGGGPFTPNPELDALADNTALDLGAYECASRMPQIADHCTLITDYSRLNYDPYVHRVLMFGGGHAATGRTDVDVLDPTTLAWTSLYPSMSCDDVALGDLDPRGFHAATGHPVARHTYDQTIVAEVDGVGRLMMFSTEGFAGYCHQYDVAIQSVASLPLDAACTTWEHSEQLEIPWSYAIGIEFDPVSGMVIAIGNTAGAGEGGMWVWDPATQSVVTYVDEVAYDGIAANLVYFPPNERMYYVSTDGIVREIALDRANWAATTSTVVAAAGPVPPAGETGYAYDSRNQVIGGAVFDGTFHVFDPVARMWCADAMQVVSDEGAAIGTGTFHELDYDPVDNVYLLIADGPAGRRTWAYRWRA